MGLILGVFAFMLDLGQLYWVRSRNQNAADAAASAAVRKLNQTPEGLREACYEATAMIEANAMVEGEFAFLANCEFPLDNRNEIKFGTWDSRGLFTISAEPLEINAIQINVARLQSKDNAVAPLFLGIMNLFGESGPSEVDVSIATVAISPKRPATAAHIFPLAASSCGFLDDTEQLACGREVVLGDNPGGLDDAANCPNNPDDCVIDSAGVRFAWTSGDVEFAEPSTFSAMTNDLLTCLKNGLCSSVQLGLGDTIYLHGTDHAGSFNDVQAQLPGFLATNSTLDVQVPIFESAEPCFSHVTPSNSVEVIGFGTLRVNTVVYTGTSQFIRGTIVCNKDTAQPGDSRAEDFGTHGRASSVLVQ